MKFIFALYLNIFQRDKVRALRKMEIESLKYDPWQASRDRYKAKINSLNDTNEYRMKNK